MKGTESWQILDGGKGVSIRPQGRFKADNGTALVAAALAGLGIACLPDSLIGEHVSAGALVRIMTRYPTPPAGVYVLRPSTQHPPKKIKFFTDLLAVFRHPARPSRLLHQPLRLGEP